LNAIDREALSHDKPSASKVFVAGQDFAIERRRRQDGEAGPHSSKNERRRSPSVWCGRRWAAKGYREKEVMSQKGVVTLGQK